MASSEDEETYSTGSDVGIDAAGRCSTPWALTQQRLAEAGRTAIESLMASPAMQQTMADIRADLQRIARDIIEPLLVQVRASFPNDFLVNTNRALLPPNIRERSDEISAAQVVTFLKEEGIPLFLVPRATTALRLLQAEDHTSRRKVLNACYMSLVEDCDAVLDSLHCEACADLVAFVRAGIAALRDGHFAAAQALFSVTLDTLISRLIPDTGSRRDLTNRRRGDTVPKVIEEMDLMGAYVWLAVWNSHQQFWTDRGDAIPNDYSRHAAVHGVSRRQYSKRNSIQALMLVTSLLGWAERRSPLCHGAD